jgi:hypothetical protein
MIFYMVLIILLIQNDTGIVNVLSLAKPIRPYS